MDYNDPKSLRGDLSLQYPEITRREAYAVRAVADGSATEDQQVLAMQVILHKLSLVDNLTYVPDSENRSTFLAGRAYVGQLVRMIMRKDIAKFKDVKTGDEK